MRLIRIVLVAASLVAALALGATAAFAAESTASPDATATAALATGTTDVQYWMAGKPNEAVAIVSVTVPESQKLPATVRIPIPAGMVVDWAGEISGADASQDVQREYTIKNDSGGTYAELQLSQFRVGQIDLSGKPMTIEGENVSVAFDFVQSTQSSETLFSVRFPILADEVEIDPSPVGDPERNEAGESLYTLPSKVLKPGEKATVTVKYLAKAPGSSAGSNQTLNLLIGALAAVAVAVLVAILFVMQRQRDAAAGGSTPPSAPRSGRSRDRDEALDSRDDNDEPFSAED